MYVAYCLRCAGRICVDMGLASSSVRWLKCIRLISQMVKEWVNWPIWDASCALSHWIGDCEGKNPDLPCFWVMMEHAAYHLQRSHSGWENM